MPEPRTPTTPAPLVPHLAGGFGRVKPFAPGPGKVRYSEHRYLELNMASHSLDVVADTNTSFWDIKLGRLARARQYLRLAFPWGAASLEEYRAVLRNPSTVAGMLVLDAVVSPMGVRLPVVARFRNGELRRGYGPPKEVYLNTVYPHPTAKDLTCVHFMGRTFEFEGDPGDGDFVSVFVTREYERLPVAGRQVLDVGASIGDSATYFAARGAARVIAVEPWPMTFNHLCKNVERNALGSVIVPMRLGVGHPGEAALDKGEAGDGAYQVRDSDQARHANDKVVVAIRSLETLTDEVGVFEGVLKMDCEGGEYAAIIEASDRILRRFSHILMEYHYGYRNLKARLEVAGFRVEFGRPNRIHYPSKSPSQGSLGMLYAERK